MTRLNGRLQNSPTFAKTTSSTLDELLSTLKSALTPLISSVSKPKPAPTPAPAAPNFAMPFASQPVAASAGVDPAVIQKLLSSFVPPTSDDSKPMYVGARKNPLYPSFFDASFSVSSDPTQDPNSSEFIGSPLEKIKQSVAIWIAQNSWAKVTLAAVFEDSRQISFTMGDDLLGFSVLFNDEWEPILIVSENPILMDHLPDVNALLSEGTQPKSVPELFTAFATQFIAKFGFGGGKKMPGMSSDQFFSSLKSSATTPALSDSLEAAKSEKNESLSGSTDAADSPVASPVDPLGLGAEDPENDPEANSFVKATEEDWHNTVLPGVRNYLLGDHFQHWEVDEWCRMLEKARQDRNVHAALCMLRDELLSGAIAPLSFRKFIPPWKAPGFEEEDDESKQLNDPENEKNRKVTVSGFEIVDGSPEATKRLLAEWKVLQTSDSKGLGFHALPVGKNLYLWNLMLFDFDSSTSIGQDLASLATIHSSPSSTSSGKLPKPFDILFEIKFDRSYPSQPPLFRLVRPRFQEHSDADLFQGIFDLESASSSSSAGPDLSSRASLSTSVQLERHTRSWNPDMSLLDLFKRIREVISTSLSLRIDMASTKDGIATVGNFWQQFAVLPAANYDCTDATIGGKILLPSSALEDIYPNSNSYYNRFDLRTSKDRTPLIFEISSSRTGKRSFVGVYEFTAPPGAACLSGWLMEHLGLQVGDHVQLRRVKLPMGEKLMLQPHSSSFTKIPNPKAMLEWQLRSFVAVAQGDMFQVEHAGKKYRFNVLKTSPDRAVAITDSDINVDFTEALVQDAESSQHESLLSSSTEIMKPDSKGNAAGTHDSTNQVEGVDFKKCSNCRHNIPVASFTMHEIQCARMNYFCEKCGDAVKKTEKQKHEDDVHGLTPCPLCQERVEKRLLKAHTRESCPERKVQCQMCELFVTAKESAEHKIACGAITEPCATCDKRVARRDKEAHKCGTPDPTPVAGVSLPSLRASSNVFICESCHTPCDGFDELQIHMLTVHDDDSSFIPKE